MTFLKKFTSHGKEDLGLPSHPVWALCRSRWYFRLNCRWHCSHSKDFVWVLMWAVNSFCWPKTSLHWLHENLPASMLSSMSSSSLLPCGKKITRECSSTEKVGFSISNHLLLWNFHSFRYWRCCSKQIEFLKKNLILMTNTRTYVKRILFVIVVITWSHLSNKNFFNFNY